MLVRMQATMAAETPDASLYVHGRVYELSANLAAKWINTGVCVAVEPCRPQTGQGREAAIVSPPETAMEETTHDASQ